MAQYWYLYGVLTVPWPLMRSGVYQGSGVTDTIFTVSDHSRHYSQYPTRMVDSRWLYSSMWKFCTLWTIFKLSRRFYIIWIRDDDSIQASGSTCSLWSAAMVCYCWHFWAQLSTVLIGQVWSRDYRADGVWPAARWRLLPSRGGDLTILRDGRVSAMIVTAVIKCVVVSIQKFISCTWHQFSTHPVPSHPYSIVPMRCQHLRFTACCAPIPLSPAPCACRLHPRIRLFLESWLFHLRSIGSSLIPLPPCCVSYACIKHDKDNAV